MSEKSNPNQPKNNIVPFIRSETREELRNKVRNKVKALEKWKNELRNNQISLEDLACFTDNWHREHDEILRIYLENNRNIIPTLSQFIAFLDELDKTTIENICMYRIFGEIDFENINSSQFLFLVIWNKKYNDLYAEYSNSNNLEKHTQNLEKFYAEISLAYQNYQEIDAVLSMYLGRLYFKIQGKLKSSRKLLE